MSKENVKVVRDAWEAATATTTTRSFPSMTLTSRFKGPSVSTIVSFEASWVSRRSPRDWLASWGELGSERRGMGRRRGRRGRGHARVGTGKAKRRPGRDTPIARVDRACRQAWRLRVYHTSDEALKSVGLEE